MILLGTSLASNHIPESVHETLVAVVNKHLPLLHRYVKLRKIIKRRRITHVRLVCAFC